MTSNSFGKGFSFGGAGSGPKFGKTLSGQGISSVFGNGGSPRAEQKRIIESEDESEETGESSESETDSLELFTNEPVAIDSLGKYVSTIMDHIEYHNWTCTTLGNIPFYYFSYIFPSRRDDKNKILKKEKLAKSIKKN